MMCYLTHGLHNCNLFIVILVRLCAWFTAVLQISLTRQQSVVNWDCIAKWPSIHKIRLCKLWSPPEECWLKWRTDSSLMGKPIPSGIEGVLGNCDGGECCACFHHNLALWIPITLNRKLSKGPCNCFQGLVAHLGGRAPLENAGWLWWNVFSGNKSKKVGLQTHTAGSQLFCGLLGQTRC